MSEQRVRNANNFYHCSSSFINILLKHSYVLLPYCVLALVYFKHQIGK